MKKNVLLLLIVTLALTIVCIFSYCSKKVMQSQPPPPAPRVEPPPPPPPPPPPAQTDRTSAKMEAAEFEMALLEEAPRRSVQKAIKKKAITTKKPSTWKRSAHDVHSAKLSIGDDNELPLKGSQYSVHIDGFRARVVMDLYYRNDMNRQVEGTFKIKLPSGASPYCFGFGETEILNTENDTIPYLEYTQDDSSGLSGEEVVAYRRSSSRNMKEAKIIPKEKAAQAYTQTVQRRVDPALMEWSGPDIFSCRVFPLSAKKLHRIYIGYDMPLVNISGDRLFLLPLPENNGATIIDISVAKSENITPEISVKTEDTGHEQLRRWHIENPDTNSITVRIPDLKSCMLHSPEYNNDHYFSAVTTPVKQTETPQNGNCTALFMVDVSISSFPDRYPVWLKLMKNILSSNSDITSFNTCFFNIETHWWSDSFKDNSETNRNNLAAFADNRALEGATDLKGAFDAVSIKLKHDKQYNIFFLSDGASTWGNDDLHAIINDIPENITIYGFNTGMSGTAASVLAALTRETGGTMMTVTGDDQLRQAATAWKLQPWKIDSVTAYGTSDILVEGRPTYVFPGQELHLCGRGIPANNEIVLYLSQGSQRKEIPTFFDNSLRSALTARVYGQTATSQLEEFGFPTEDASKNYSLHYSVPGKTCSFVMLETKEDYERFGIKDTNVSDFIAQHPVNSVIKSVLAEMSELLGSAKAAFINWLKKLPGQAGFTWEMDSLLLKTAEELPESAFVIPMEPVNGMLHEKKYQDKELQFKGVEAYDDITEKSEKRKVQWKTDDALKLLSSMVEMNPGDGILARDIGYTAMTMEKYGHAWYLFKKQLENRPWEPQTYLAAAELYEKKNLPDVALLYYDIAFGSQWESRFGEFNLIAGLKYTRFLNRIKNGGITVLNRDFSSHRMKSVAAKIEPQKSDIVIFITWNTDQTDIDLHVKEPTGEECYYKHKKTTSGGRITRDVTQGYGPEMYVNEKAPNGTYKINVRFYSNNGNRTSVRTKVYATVYKNWGTPQESVETRVVSLRKAKDIITIFETNLNN